MKPQCNTSADCLRELARVMDQFGYATPHLAAQSRHVKHGYTTFDPTVFPTFTEPHLWQFAISEVEGKPVFVGDELWCNGDKYIIASKHPNCDSLQWKNGEQKLGMPLKNWSWNPPKTETVMLELRREVAECLAYGAPHEEAVEACKKALEKLK